MKPLLAMMFHLSLLENAIVISEVVPCGKIQTNEAIKTESARIVGGIDTSTLEVPWQVSIHFNHTFLCGGSILDKWWILTASHCFKNDDISHLEVYLAVEDSDKSVEKKNVKKLILHPNFNQRFMDHDIALILLDSLIEFNTRKIPICLTKKLENIEECWVSGWGKTQPLMIMDIPLQKVQLEILDWEKCSNIVYLLTENMICAWDPEWKKDSCQAGGSSPLHLRPNPSFNKYLRYWTRNLEFNGGGNMPTILYTQDKYRIYWKYATEQRVTVGDLWFATKRITQKYGTKWALSAGEKVVVGKGNLVYTQQCPNMCFGLC